MPSSRTGATFSRTAGRHRRPSPASVAVPTSITGGLLLASAAGGIATAAPAAANENAGGGSASSDATASSSVSNASATSRASADFPDYPHLLSRGDIGKYVELVQKELGVATDGIFGPITEGAVKDFQRSHGLVVDGLVGPDTWAALEQAASGGGGGSSVQVSLAKATSDVATSLAARALDIAAAQEGIPYVFGGASPAEGFDCSGLVKYVYGKLGYSLPHNADAQYDVVNHVPRSDLRPGDIVFLSDSSGEVYHNGIYAGNGKWWVARHSGTTVTKQDAYWMGGGYNWSVGRVG